jgi:hypothetical protein
VCGQQFNTRRHKVLRRHDEIRIAAEAIVCQRTVQRVYLGGGNEYSKQRVAAAAQALGLPLPPLSRTRSTESSSSSSSESPTPSKVA